MYNYDTRTNFDPVHDDHPLEARGFPPHDMTITMGMLPNTL